MDDYRKYLGKTFFAVPKLTYVELSDKCKTTSQHVKNYISKVIVKKIEIDEDDVALICKNIKVDEKAGTIRIHEKMIFNTPEEAEVDFYDRQISLAENYIKDIKELKMKTVVGVKR